MARQRISQFDDNAMRRIAAVIRRVEGQPQPLPPRKDPSDARGLQVRFGITCAPSGGSYPAAPASVFAWKPLTRKPAALTVGDQEIEKVESTEIRKGASLLGGYIAEGIVVETYRIGGHWWLRPFPGVLFGETTSTITGRSGGTLGSGTVKIYSLGATWTVVQSEGADLVVTAKSIYTATVDSGKAVTVGIDAYSGLYGLLGADCA